MNLMYLRRLAPPKKLILGLMIFGVLGAMVAPVLAQGDQPAAPSPTPAPVPTPIPASQIPARVGEVAALLRGFETHVVPRDEIGEIAEDLPKIEEAITSLDSEIRPMMETDGPVQALKDTDADLARVEHTLTDWLDLLNSRTVELDDDLTKLRSLGKLWELTLGSAGAEELPVALVQQLRDTIAKIKSVDKAVVARRAELLTLQAEVAEQRGRIRALSEEIRTEIDDRQEHLLRLDSPPLWKAFGGTREDHLGGQVLEAMKRNYEALEKYVRESARALVRDAVIFVFVLILFVRLGRQARLWARSDETLHTTAALLDRPLAASVLVTLTILGSGLHSTAPEAAINLMGIVLLLAMIRLLPCLVRPQMRPVIGMLILLIVLFLLVDLVPSTFLLDRIGKLVLALLGAGTCGWAMHKELRWSEVEKDIWFWGAFWVGVTAAVFFSVSALANIIGAVALASLLATATLASIYDAVILWIFAVLLFSALTIALRTTNARRLLIVRYHSDRIRQVLVKVIKVVAVVGWVGSALEHFDLFDGMKVRIEGIFFAEYQVGEFSLSVSSVVIFIAVIWFSVKLAQFTCFILDEDVLPRLDLPRGVPATISKTSTYVVVTLGCIVAVAAAGIDLSQATILVGALGVGIGFGLQNAVNNFVSGLILLFGRPINVGDKIQIGEVSGLVKDIGIRATMVGTWQGAEVIVPNATLISENLVNWTLSDDRRRMEIPVGVAYGTPAEKVIELLTEVAKSHHEVLDDPEPKTIFTGFGDSSLDFELRAWTRGDFVAIASDLRVGIDTTLALNGLEIPFPQRDLHLRTVDERAAARLAGDQPESSMDVETEASPPQPGPQVDNGPAENEKP